MATAEQDAQEKILAEKFDELTRDVDWQLSNLLIFIVKYFQASMVERKNMSQSERRVQDFLDDYLYLVAKFYLQFKGDLEKEYTKNKNVSEKEVPVLMQQALDKLAEEWERVYGSIMHNTPDKIKESEKFVENLIPVIDAAISDVGLSPKACRVIPQLGKSYSLGFFNYSDDFMALNVPLPKIKSPWEWTIYWHEMAGQRVRLLRKESSELRNRLEELFMDIKKNPENYPDDQALVSVQSIAGIPLWDRIARGDDIPHQRYSDAVSKDLDDFLRSDLAFPSLTNIKDVFKDRELPMVMFSFDDLYSEILDELLSRQNEVVMGKLLESLKGVLTPASNQNNGVTNEFVGAMERALALNGDFAAQKKALTEKGWSADWLEELFEDSFSVVSFNLEFLYLFDSVLNRYKGEDQRHPPQHVRLAVALSVKLLSFKDELKINKTLPKLAEWPPHEEAMGLSQEEYKSLIGFYSEDQKADAEVIWLVAKKIWDLHKWMKIQHNDTDEKKAITKAMADYRTKPGKDWYSECEAITQIAFPFLAGLKVQASNETDQLKSRQDRIDMLGRSIDRTAIDDFLKTKSMINPRPLGYRELLELSFYDEDFVQFTPVTIKNLTTNKSFVYHGRKGPIPPDISSGTVSYTVDNGQTRKTTPKDWKRVFG